MISGGIRYTMATPWGEADSIETLAVDSGGNPTALRVCTPSHGGIGVRGLVFERLRAAFPDFVPFVYRHGLNPGEWYWLEEDCDAAAALAVIPQHPRHAKALARVQSPGEWGTDYYGRFDAAALSGCAVPPKFRA